MMDNVLESATDTTGETNECNHIMRWHRDNPDTPSAIENFIVQYNQVSKLAPTDDGHLSTRLALSSLQK
jgi:hypothetical protein